MDPAIIPGTLGTRQKYTLNGAAVCQKGPLSTHSFTPKCNVAKPLAALYLKSRKKTREPVRTLIRTRKKTCQCHFLRHVWYMNNSIIYQFFTFYCFVGSLLAHLYIDMYCVLQQCLEVLCYDILVISPTITLDMKTA